MGREGFAVPEHFPTFKIFFPRLEGPFRRVASLAEIFHPLLWNEPQPDPTQRVMSAGLKLREKRERGKEAEKVNNENEEPAHDHWEHTQ